MAWQMALAGGVYGSSRAAASCPPSISSAGPRPSMPVCVRVQERLWKQAAARALAYAAVEHRPALRHVACPAAKEMGEAVAAEVCPCWLEQQ